MESKWQGAKSDSKRPVIGLKGSTVSSILMVHGPNSPDTQLKDYDKGQEKTKAPVFLFLSFFFKLQL